MRGDRRKRRGEAATAAEHPLQADLQTPLSNRAPAWSFLTQLSWGRGNKLTWPAPTLALKTWTTGYQSLLGPSGQIKQTLAGQHPCRGAPMACPGLPQSCCSPRGQQGPWAVLGRGRARTSWALQSPHSPGTVGNKLRKPRQGKSPNCQTPPPPAPRCHHNSSCNHGRKTNLPRVLPWGTPEAESKPGKNPHRISRLISTAKENTNDLASDQRREPRKQKHDPGDEK